ncbi:ATP-binding cassette domain-containing protein [Spelaeicoccus albus]|uniref:ABC-type cobalamin/Fe3+-siderophores transport system ATPase subunit n=1 Tax=Spelaeicoccus albus TaxID=1280376 RepID=A0A7Z0D4G6_9MICO|nr:ATP-binding cassette domain-containing protein [Spelaeicoccus albus]NYI68700.1 ABC-type cobalamin/Fe3+-siderophores transport system ATPase subunit [Spelaeicoccus albus]
MAEEHASASAGPEAPKAPEEPVEESASDKESAPEPAIDAYRLSVSSGGSSVFHDISVQVPAGGILVIKGPAGSGKTSLALTLSGRMKPTAGTARVLGVPITDKPSKVRALTSLGESPGVNDLDSDLTVEQHVAERLILLRPWYKPFASRTAVRDVLIRARNIVTDAIADAWPTTDDDPDPGTAFVRRLGQKSFIGDLTQLQKFAVSTALAVMGSAPVVVIDNIDSLGESADRYLAWSALATFVRRADREITLIVTCQDDRELTAYLDSAPDAGTVVRVNL